MFPHEALIAALEKEFALAYHGHLGSVASWQSCPVAERNWHYDKLEKVKADEREKQQKEIDETRAKMASMPRRSKKGR